MVVATDVKIVSTEYFSTTEYSIFTYSPQQRRIQRSHVEAIKQSIRVNNKLYFYPIIVNMAMEVLDGQHRLAAAKDLKVPIYFIKSDEVTIQDIAYISNVNKGWTKDNWLDFYLTLAKENDSPEYKEYRTFNHFYKGYPWLTITSAIKLATKAVGNQTWTQFESGKYEANNIEFAHQVLNACEDFEPYFPQYKHAHFIDAMYKILKKYPYDRERMLDKLEIASGRLHGKTKVSEYIGMLDDLYNFNAKKAKVNWYIELVLMK